MKIKSVTHAKVGRECLCTVEIEVAKKEKMIITVIVPPHEKENDAIREFCIARAKDFARRFAGMSDR
jgi:hypothetical protein